MFQNKCGGAMTNFFGMDLYHVAHSKARAHIDSKWPKFAPKKTS